MKENILSEDDVELFYRLKHLLYIYANRRIHAIPDTSDWRSLGNVKLEKLLKIRDYVFIKNRGIIGDFVRENPFSLPPEEIGIVRLWEKVIVAEKAILYKYKKQHTLFLHKGSVYGLKGLMDPLSDLFGGHSPFFIDLIILPFKGMLTYEGMFMAYRVLFGRNMARTVAAEAEESILKKGIILSLDGPVRDGASDADMLRFYMKSEGNRDRFQDAIESLRRKSEDLQSVYTYETGRISARTIKADLKALGLQGYFAVLHSHVIASGSTRKEMLGKFS